MVSRRTASPRYHSLAKACPARGNDCHHGRKLMVVAAHRSTHRTVMAWPVAHSRRHVISLPPQFTGYQMTSDVESRRCHSPTPVLITQRLGEQDRSGIDQEDRRTIQHKARCKKKAILSRQDGSPHPHPRRPHRNRPSRCACAPSSKRSSACKTRMWDWVGRRGRRSPQTMQPWAWRELSRPWRDAFARRTLAYTMHAAPHVCSTCSVYPAKCRLCIACTRRGGRRGAEGE